LLAEFAALEASVKDPPKSKPVEKVEEKKEEVKEESAEAIAKKNIDTSNIFRGSPDARKIVEESKEPSTIQTPFEATP